MCSVIHITSESGPKNVAHRVSSARIEGFYINLLYFIWCGNIGTVMYYNTKINYEHMTFHLFFLITLLAMGYILVYLSLIKGQTASNLRRKMRTATCPYALECKRPVKSKKSVYTKHLLHPILYSTPRDFYHSLTLRAHNSKSTNRNCACTPGKLNSVSI